MPAPVLPQARLHRVASVIVLGILLASPVAAAAQEVTVRWDPSPPSDRTTAYDVCIGTAPGSCNARLAPVGGSKTSYRFRPQPGVLYHVAVRARGAGGIGPYSREVTFSIPHLAQPGNQMSTAHVPIRPLHLAAEDPDGDPVSFRHAGLPVGLQLDARGRISGTPTAPGTHQVTVFVSDGLKTVARSFSWTVKDPPRDTAAPALTVTSHRDGSEVTTRNVTLTGVATDGGSGGSGIARVTVNGGAAAGGRVGGVGTATWNRTVALGPGVNTITIEASDGAGNTRMQQLTLHYGSAEVPGTVVLRSDVASPRSLGTTVRFTADVTGGRAPLQYKWWVRLNAGRWLVAREWTTSPSLAWRPGVAGAYTVAVWVRNAGETADRRQAMRQVRYEITTRAPSSPVPSAASPASSAASPAPPLVVTSLTSSRPSPQTAGTTVRFTARAGGGRAPYQYKWLVRHNGGYWQFVRDWSRSQTLDWRPAENGSYLVRVWVRSYGSTVDGPEARAQIPFQVRGGRSSSTTAPTVASPPPTTTTSSSSLLRVGPPKSDVRGPFMAGRRVRLTATAWGGQSPYQYKWWVRSNGGGWTLLQNWTSSRTAAWVPRARGSYQVKVWVRSSGARADAGEATEQTGFLVR